MARGPKDSKRKPKGVSGTTGPGPGEGTKERTNISGRVIQGLYTPADLSDFDYHTDLGYPGEHPFTRGIHATMYRGRLWTMRQYAGFGTAEESNQRYRYLLSQGNTGLSVAFDLPTQMGFDSDHPRAQGEVGRVGVAISSLADMQLLFDGIPLQQVSTSMTINATAPILLAMYVSVAEGQGVARGDLRGTVQNDILKEYAARGTYIYPPQPSLRLATDLIEFCSREMPRWNPISISGYHMREAGCTAAQEVAFTLAHARAYVDHALDRGLAVDEFAPQLSFFFASQMDLMEEVAKFRAARRLWASIMRDEYGAKDPRSMMLRFHAQTAGVALTAQQPENNVVRVALQALAAILGGAQSLHANALDEALGLPTERAVRIALRTQQILAHESGVANTADPGGGAYFLESLTEDVEKDARAYLETIRRKGGALRALEQGYIQKEISEAAYRYQREMEKEQRVVVGLNRYTMDDQSPRAILRIDPALETKQQDRLKRFRDDRNNDGAVKALAKLGKAAAGEGNLLPFMIAAVRAGATLGEISDALAGVFGRFRGVRVV